MIARMRFNHKVPAITRQTLQMQQEYQRDERSIPDENYWLKTFENACISALMLVALSTPLRAELGDAGTNAADFLRINAGAAAAAQGEAYVARSGGIEVLPYNPAGLRWMDRSEIILQHNEYLSDIRSEYIAGATSAGSFRIGAAIHFLDYGSFTRRTISRPTGAGSFDADAWTGSLALAAPLGQSFSLGVEARLFKESIDDASRTSGSANIGMHYRPRKYQHTELGVVVRHLGTTVTFDRDREKLPLEYAVGGSALMMERLRFSAELAFPRNQNMDYKVGGDLRIVDGLNVRGGFNSRNDLGSGLSLGVGVQYRSLMFDYAWVDYDKAGAAHRMALTTRFGEITKTSNESTATNAGEQSTPPETGTRESESRDRPASRIVK